MNENIILNEAGIQKFPSSVAVVDVEVGKGYWRFKQRNSSSTGTPNTGGGVEQAYQGPCATAGGSGIVILTF
jgi:hypothetical protein